MNNTLRTMLGVAGLIVATQAAAQVTFYEREGCLLYTSDAADE